MLGIRIFTASLLLAAAAAQAQQPDYYPLYPGNIWIYRCTGACGAQSTLTIQVGPSKDVNGTTYFQLQGWFGKDYLVREDENGVVWAYDPDSNAERVWYAFQTPVGATYDESIPSGCCGKATIQSTSAHYEGPIGIFDSALEIQYPGVFQVGIYRELFLPYIGLIARSEAAGGPAVRNYDLIYCRLGGVTVVSQPEISTGLALDSALYKAGDMLSARLSIRNSTADPISLTFLTGQIYDLEIRDGQGNVVFLWSKGKVFPQIVITLPIQDEKDYVIAAPLANLPAGKYVVQGWFTVEGPARAYSSSARFEIK